MNEPGKCGETIGSLSSYVFERCTSTGSEPFSLLISLDATVFLLPSVLILIETICLKVYSKSRLKCAKSPFPVDVRRSKTSLLKLPNSRRVRTHEENWGETVRRLGTIIQSIFLCPIRSRHPLEFLEIFRWESVPRGSFARTWKLSSRLFSRPDWLPLCLRGCLQCKFLQCKF